MNHYEIPKDLIPKLTDGSVISLGNILALRARSSQKCDLPQEEYETKVQQNEKFGSFFFAIASSSKLPGAALIKKNHPQLQLSEDPSAILAKHPLPRNDISSQIDGQLESWMAKRTERDPYFIAATWLLGKNLSWNDRSLLPLPPVPLNPDGTLNSRPLDNLFEHLRKSEDPAASGTLAELLLKDLRDFYLHEPR